MDNKSIAHTRWNCTYHIVFIPKYRRKIMYGETKRDLVEIIKKLCEMKQVQLIEGKICRDHIHMYVAIPPKLSVSEFMSYLKGKSALMFFDRHPELRPKYSDRHFWARGYYVGTVGNVNEDTIVQYIREQEEKSGIAGETGQHRQLFHLQNRNPNSRSTPFFPFVSLILKQDFPQYRCILYSKYISECFNIKMQI